ncbi:hypothetical protein Tco_0611730 [Tanacetum coccineum]
MVVMFDETATALVGCSAGSLMDIEDKSADNHIGLPPTISNVTGTTQVMEIKSHSYYEYRTFKSFICWQLNLEEEEPKRIKSLVIEDSDAKASGDSSGYARKNNADPLYDNNKRKWFSVSIMHLGLNTDASSE